MITVIYILGAGNSGSTIFSMALGGHSQITSVGELSQIGRWYGRDELCSCGQSMRKCVVWSNILGSNPADLLGAEYGRNSRRLSTEASVALYRKISQETQTSVIVDASKDPGRLMQLRKQRPSDITILPVLLVRDGRAYIDSMNRRVQARDSAGSGVTRRLRRSVLPAHSFTRWAKKNLLSLFALRRSGLRDTAIKLDYDRFSRDPADHLAQVCAAVGLPYESGMLEYWRQTHHNVAGTPSRFSPQPINPRTRWHSSLPRAPRVLFALLGGYQLNRIFGVGCERG